MKIEFLKNVIGLGVLITLFSFEPATGWHAAGSNPQKYDMGVDKGAGPEGKDAASIKSTEKKIKGFGTLMQSCLAEKYLGKRVKMSGLVKSLDVSKWAGLWMRADDKAQQVLAFDNMNERSIKGTSDWKKYEIVLDIPTSAVSLAYGALLAGEGQIWFTDISIEVVDSSIPLTKENTLLKEPTNLKFEK